ncbi:MAG: PepSY domain-containing protein [Alphaproteobacteria bacterium]|nr:PepSY domain-containing protein [Alphaproteobacteria bacterium]
MLQRRFIILILAAAAAVLALPMMANADHRGGLIFVQQGRRDHDRARDAVNAGKTLPLQQILQRISGRYPGRLLDANLARNNQGRWIYRLKLLTPDNRVQNLEVDAQSGQVLQSGGRR